MTVGVEPDPAKRMRKAWAQSLSLHMSAMGVTRQQLRLLLSEDGTEVTEQAIGCWLRGESAPRPHHQAAIAKALKVPGHLLFPIGSAA